MHISLERIVVKTFEFLHFGDATESKGGQNLSLSTRKHARTVNSGQDTHFTPNRSYIFESTSVGSYSLFADTFTNEFFLHCIQNVGNVTFFVGINFRKVSHEFVVDGVFSRFSFLSVERVVDIRDFIGGIFSDFLFEFFGSMAKLYVLFGLAYFLLDFFYPSDDSFNFFVSEKNCSEHFFFGKLVRACLNHHNSVFRSAESKVKSALFTLFGVGVYNVFAVDQTYHYGTRRSVPRNIGYGKSDTASEHTEYFGRNVGIHAERGSYYRYVVK